MNKEQKESRKNPLRVLKFPPVLFTLIIITVFLLFYAYDYFYPSIPGTQPPPQAVRVITLEAMESPDMSTYGFNATQGGPAINVTKGETIRIVLINKGRLVHDFMLGPPYNIRIGPVAPRATDYKEFTAHTAGEFPYYCSITGHRERGMEGKLIVSEG